MITIGCPNIMNAVSFLEKDFNVCYPHLAYQGKKFKTNFDVLLQFDYEINGVNSKQLIEHGYPVIGTSRYSKFKQMTILDALDINHPEIYKSILNGTNDDRNDIMQVLLNEYDDHDKLVLKAENGARGLGQIIVNRNTFYDIIDMVQHDTGSVEDMADKIVADYQTGSDIFRHVDEKNYIVNILKEEDYHIEKYIPRRAEYRLIAFYGSDPIIIERKCPKGEKWQANASVTGEGKRMSETDMQPDDWKAMKELGQKMCSYLRSPWLSIDVYFDSDNKMGVFEFQMQFGYKKVPKKELVNKINEATHNILKQLYPNLKK